MENGTNKLIKIAQVIGMAINGGTETLWMNYYRNIDRTKVQFDFLVESESKIINKEEIEKLGGHVVIIPPYKNVFKYMKTLRKIFKENQYDIVHSNMSTMSVFTLRAAKKAGIKVRIAHSHSTSNKKEWKKNILKNLLRPFSKKYSTHYFSCSELAGRYLFGDKTVNKGKVTIINNAIDINRFEFKCESRNKIREELGINDEVVIGNVGRFQAQKNQTYLLDIFNEYQKINNNSKLLILGDGPLREDLKTKTEKLGITDKVIFAGVKTNPEDYYSAMDCFVLPSLYEGLPVVGIEVQASNLPFFMSDTITKECMLNDNVYALSIKDDPKKWAEFINEKLVIKDDRGTSTLTGTKYDLKTEANVVCELYEKILK